MPAPPSACAMPHAIERLFATPRTRPCLPSRSPMTAVEYTRAVILGAVVAAFPALPLADYLALVRDVEARGYHTAWLGETAGGDAITLMTLIASQTTRIGVASGVIPIQTRSPIILGMSAATLAHVAPGRISLGLGVSSRIIVEQWHGVPFQAGLV